MSIGYGGLEELRLDWIYRLASFKTMSVGYDGLDELRSGLDWLGYQTQA